MIDLHSHLLPGIDDGSRSFEESLEIARGLAEHNISDLFLTPHYIADSSYVNSRANNKKLLTAFQKQLDDAQIDIKLYLGNEIYITPNIKSLLRRRQISPLGGPNSRYLLIELPMSGRFPSYRDIFRDLIDEGYHVVLAHPERYRAMQENPQLLLDLYDDGVLFQCNLGSILGQYGRHAKKTMKFLLKRDLVFAFGTDIHHPRDYREITKAQIRLRRYLSIERILELINDNPRIIIDHS
ncbi:hypothetical protein IKF15_02695 [Candidatus Saccharibacteria bacterium]|nr:hypothetical protein [Candidatus Saccharibacteria bacterium]